MLLTVSVAKVRALVETRRGWTTFSSTISVIAPRRTLMPEEISPLTWRLRKSVTVAMGFNPAFSAKVDGITSKALPKALKYNKKKLLRNNLKISSSLLLL